METAELLPLLQCLQAQKRVYPRGGLIFSEGERATQLGIVLTGRVNTVYEDVFGGRSIIGSMESGQLFCDAFACTEDQRLPVSVMAQTTALCCSSTFSASPHLRPTPAASTSGSVKPHPHFWRKNT